MTLAYTMSSTGLMISADDLGVVIDAVTVPENWQEEMSRPEMQRAAYRLLTQKGLWHEDGRMGRYLRVGWQALRARV